MHIVGSKKLEDLKKRHTETVKHLDRWSQIVTQAQWKTPYDIENQLPTARALGGGSDRHVFNIMGNKCAGGLRFKPSGDSLCGNPYRVR